MLAGVSSHTDNDDNHHHRHHCPVSNICFFVKCIYTIIQYYSHIVEAHLFSTSTPTHPFFCDVSCKKSGAFRPGLRSRFSRENLTSPSAEGESYESLKQKGLKSWLSENLESAKGMATRHLDQRNVYQVPLYRPNVRCTPETYLLKYI